MRTFFIIAMHLMFATHVRASRLNSAPYTPKDFDEVDTFYNYVPPNGTANLNLNGEGVKQNMG